MLKIIWKIKLMSYVYVIKHGNMTNNKSEEFLSKQQEISLLCKALSHPARIAIIQLLAEKKEIRSGNISLNMPISRTTVSQHLKALKKIGIIKGKIDGLSIHYCLDMKKLSQIKTDLNNFFGNAISDFKCNC